MVAIIIRVKAKPRIDVAGVNNGVIVTAADANTTVVEHCQSLTLPPPVQVGHPSTGEQHGPARSSAIGRRVTGVFVRRTGQPARPGTQRRGQDPARRPWSPRVIAVCPRDRPRHPGLCSATNAASIRAGDSPTAASLRPRGLDRCRVNTLTTSRLVNS